MTSDADPSFHKAREAVSYDPVISAFDRLVEEVSPPLVGHMLRLAKVTPGEHILDVGTGTGIVALEAARAVPGSSVLGIDLSQAMVAAATTNAAHLGLADGVLFQTMDAEQLALRSRTFDVVLSLFALTHLPNPLRAIGEMFRVLRPGGRLVLAVGSAPPSLSLKGVVHRVRGLAGVVSGRIGRRLTAPQFIEELVEERFGRSDTTGRSELGHHAQNRAQVLRHMVGAAGFVGVASDWSGTQLVIATPEEFWEIQRTFSSRVREQLSAAPPTEIRALQEEFFLRCESVLARGGQLDYPIGASFISARRPLHERA